MPCLPPGRGVSAVERRLDRMDWAAVEASLRAHGYAVTEPLLNPEECAAIAGHWAHQERFRMRVDMVRHRFGSGEYRYFAYPLPPLIAAIRERAYRHLAPMARRWAEALGSSDGYPDRIEDFLALCRRRGQTRPTPLLLRYVAGDYNCLHQDLYGPVAFPFQLACMLSRPRDDYSGGEFLLVEQRPRAQSRGEAIVLSQGEAVIFATRHRPAAGARGTFRATLRHGVSRVRTGERMTLGVILHDAA
jgi:hypothetical protein